MQAKLNCILCDKRIDVNGATNPEPHVLGIGLLVDRENAPSV